jgi:23S rRNA (uracil1939-C5)-methyltransferase
MEPTTLHIEGWDSIGRGVASWRRPDDRVVSVAVRGAIIDETVEVGAMERDRRGNGRYEASPVSVVTPALGRTTPRCPHVGECGGCVWQHIEYPYQLQYKQARLEALFAPLRTGRMVVHPIIGCDLPWQYRNKMEFSFAQDRQGKRFLGLYKCTHRGGVFDLTTCCLTHEWMANTVQAIRQWWVRSGLDAYYLPMDKGSLQTVTMRESATTGDRMVLLTVSGNPDYAVKQHHLDDFVATVRGAATPPEGTLSVVLRIKQIAKGRPTQFYEMMLTGPDHIREILEVEPVLGKKHALEFHISPQAFFQPNTRQAMAIYSRALQLAHLSKDQLLIDLYCGIGLFGMFASLEVRQALGVELSRESAYDAKTNASRLGLSQFSVHCGDVADVVKEMGHAKGFERPSTVIIDPPRSGLTPAALFAIVSLEPDTIIYVSCNPETQVRDAKLLVERGWTVEAVQPVDQFPHTVHVENVLRLVQ